MSYKDELLKQKGYVLQRMENISRKQDELLSYDLLSSEADNMLRNQYNDQKNLLTQIDEQLITAE